jgi:Ser/Thr protein kinase RdoA (MazF antagonist)
MNLILSASAGQQVSLEQLKVNLETYYGVTIRKVTILDLNVHRVDIQNGPTWIARVFTQSSNEVAELVKLLDYLQQSEFPAEIYASPQPVSESSLGGRILVTEFVDGSRPERNRQTFRRLGELLGRLHVIPVPDWLRRGGAWHHLSASGGLSEECEAARTMLETFKAQHKTDNLEHVDRLMSELGQIQGFEDLPSTIVHPDFVPSNVIGNASTGNWTIIDWAGAGCGPRLISLGFLLLVAGVKGKMTLVDSVMSGYASHVKLEQSELDRLSMAIFARPLTMNCWEVSLGRKDVVEVVQGLPALFELADKIAVRVRELVGR